MNFWTILGIIFIGIQTSLFAIRLFQGNKIDANRSLLLIIIWMIVILGFRIEEIINSACK